MSQIITTSGIVQSGSAAAVGVMERDSNGDTNVRDVTASRALRSSGSLFLGHTNKTTSFTADTTSTTYTCDTTGGSITVTLPAAASCTGQHYIVKKTNAANSLIVDPSAAETIDTSTTKTATANLAAMHFWSDGTTWWIVTTFGTWT